ncbi:MAG: thiamine phosphate synthase [Rickettsiales bacterium]|nr:thiamine phosphate synthase [Pseudomonadota bacterium]MDA0966584.1 thiamine phosphate synthase [Pseudomonadota bacterium]MDG4543613.1 thiamine phosphate synthase [Rickettsiales bacterium]MDG4545760.1 thiamine phosphate synthase [Rickettsiales bacterium]MDG4547467.1 thiamine phosphate synthase [Rickettsiales bacterium]
MNTQLYIISPEKFELAKFKTDLEKSLATGKVSVFQLRLKNTDDEKIIGYSKEIIPICHKYNVQFILNDRPDLAAIVNADGVHIGEEQDGTVATARKLLGNKKVIGVSCYGSTDRALEMAEAGADYVAFGAFFPTQTKEPKARPKPDILKWWVTNCSIPCVAIGGIKADNCNEISKTGTDFIAVVSAIWQHPEGCEFATNELYEAIKQR